MYSRQSIHKELQALKPQLPSASRSAKQQRQPHNLKSHGFKIVSHTAKKYATMQVLTSCYGWKINRYIIWKLFLDSNGVQSGGEKPKHTGKNTTSEKRPYVTFDPHP